MGMDWDSFEIEQARMSRDEIAVRLFQTMMTQKNDATTRQRARAAVISADILMDELDAKKSDQAK